MFLEKYLDDVYYQIVLEEYDERYLRMLDEKNFQDIYFLLKERNCYFVEDVIIKYLELFELDRQSVEYALDEMRKYLGEEYMRYMGKDMTLFDRLLQLALHYSKEED